MIAAATLLIVDAPFWCGLVAVAVGAIVLRAMP